jgi:EAL and modified HD-GYP domain-containing signal transduction protein
MLNHSGPEGMVLQLVQSHEQGEWDKIDWEALGKTGLTPERLAQIYVESLQWVAETVNTLGLSPTN